MGKPAPYIMYEGLSDKDIINLVRGMFGLPPFCGLTPEEEGRLTPIKKEYERTHRTRPDKRKPRSKRPS